MGPLLLPRQGWQGPVPPAAPRPRAQSAFVRAQPAGITSPRERTGRSPAADCSSQAGSRSAPALLAPAPRDWGLSGTGWHCERPAGPSAPTGVWPLLRHVRVGERRAVGKGLCHSAAPWASRDARMAGTDGGCSRGRVLEPRLRLGAGGCVATGTPWAAAGRQDLCEAARGCPAATGLLPATVLSLWSPQAVVTARCQAHG